MAAMPFPCTGILLIQGNLPRVFPVFTFKYASFPIPYFNYLKNYTLIKQDHIISSLLRLTVTML